MSVPPHNHDTSALLRNSAHTHMKYAPPHPTALPFQNSNHYYPSSAVCSTSSGFHNDIMNHPSYPTRTSSSFSTNPYRSSPSTSSQMSMIPKPLYSSHVSNTQSNFPTTIKTASNFGRPYSAMTPPTATSANMAMMGSAVGSNGRYYHPPYTANNFSGSGGMMVPPSRYSPSFPGAMHY
jgi:hypothetical protein